MHAVQLQLRPRDLVWISLDHVVDFRKVMNECLFALCPVPSQPPENVNAMAVTSQSILVLWNPPPSSDQNGVLIGYRILYRVVRDDEGTVISLRPVL